MSVRIRTAREADAEELLSIYAPYVLDTAITFEYEVPSIEEFRRRIRDTLLRYPYLVAEDEQSGVLLGYAYASVFHARPAYDWAVETSIYVRRDRRKTGAGRLLHDALERALKAQGILNMNACIACPPQGSLPGDNAIHLDRNSIEFHAHMGYRLVGTFYQCGYKFHQWYDMVWMEKLIGEHLVDQPPIKLYPEVEKTLES